MRKLYIALLGAAMPMAAWAQSAVDAQLISQSNLTGSARFMSMGGAFTALGGDLSCLNQNPAGIGVYNRSEIGATLDINMQNTSTTLLSNMFPNSASQTKVYCNNFGYVGATKLDGALRTFNWGVTYNRASSFDRFYQGYNPSTSTSLSNYIADFSYGIPEYDIQFGTDGYNPYLDSNYDWLSILAYNSYMINPDGTTQNGGNTYRGLFGNGTQGDALYSVREQGYVDEYDVSFGGNVENTVYWGLSFGITDLNYKRWAFYSESMESAQIPEDAAGANGLNGAAGFDLDNYKYIHGSGFNIKAGVIIKPVNEFRIGLGVHTPTWYSLNTIYNAGVQYAYTPTSKSGDPIGDTLTNGSNWEETDNANYDWKFNAPWRFMVGAAAVVGNKAIISVDYQFDGYNSMNIKTPAGYDNYGYSYDFVPNYDLNNNIKTYYKNANTVRVGLEYRVTPQFSLRAGYNHQFSNVKEEVANNQVEVLTSGTDPSYSLDRHTQYFTAGLGYKYKAWYIDAAYVYKDRESTYHAFTNWGDNQAPQSIVTDHNSSIVISTGFKF